MLQGSILGPILFNIFLNDLFFFISNFSLSDYADDNTLYTFGDNLKKIKYNLQNSFDTAHQWFYENYTLLNSAKCLFFCLKNNTENEHSYCIKSCISELCKKASQKIESLSRLSSYLHISDKKINFQFDNKITI